MILQDTKINDLNRQLPKIDLWAGLHSNRYVPSKIFKEKRYAIKFCFKLGKNATETYGMLQTAFGASCMNWASVFE